MKVVLPLILIALVTACSAKPQDYANRDEIRADLKRLYEAKKHDDRDTILTVAQRILASSKTTGSVRMPALLYTAEIKAKEGHIAEVDDLFEQQFPLVMKSTGDCSHAVFSAMKADVWKEADRLDLAIRDYNQATEKCPKMDNGYSKLATIYATASDPNYRDPQKALSLAEKALAIRRSARSLTALAAAYAASGDPARAAEHMEAAIQAGETERLPASEMEAMRTDLAGYTAQKASSDQ